MHIVTGIMAVFLTLTVTGTGMSTRVLLGVDDILLSVVVLALLVWTLFMVMSLYLVLHASRYMMLAMRSSTDYARYVT